MATPKINLIPVGYYERKKAKTAGWLAGLLLVCTIGGLLWYNQMLTAEQTRLTAEQTLWQGNKDRVDGLTTKASEMRASVATVAGKVKFVDDAIKANAAWADVFVNLVSYSHPKVQFTNIKPTAGSDMVAMKVRMPDQMVLNQYWTNLLRSPRVKTALPSTMLASGSIAGAEGSSEMVGAPYPGGMPSPGGASPYPGGMGPRGPMPYPGAPPAPSSPQQTARDLAGQVQDGTLGTAEGQVLLGADGQPIPGFESIPPSLLQSLRSPFTYEVDMTAQLTEPIRLPSYGNATADAGQAT